MSIIKPSLVALYKILTWKDQLDEWKQISIQLDFLDKDNGQEMCATLLTTATNNEYRNIQPIKKFIGFYMHPPRDAPRPLNTLIGQLTEAFAEFSTTNSSNELATCVTARLDPSHLQFLMNNVSPKAQVVLCQQPSLRLYCESGSPPTRIMDDMYRISVDRNYHTLAPILHWILEDFPGSFNPAHTDNMTIDTETAAEKANRETKFNQECDSIRQMLATTNGTELNDKLNNFILAYDGKL